MKRNKKVILVMSFNILFNLFGFVLSEPLLLFGQSKGRISLPREGVRDPFLLPSGVRLLSKNETLSETKGIRPIAEIKPAEGPYPLKVKAIMIGDHVRLALIDRNIVTVGDLIQDEKVMEIKKDRVILMKKDQKRTLLLPQSPILLTVEGAKGEEQ